jgi:CRP/FNR family transcriptional regulator, cyclic AMP receptor protein
MGTFAAYLKETDLFNNLTDGQLELIERICEDRIYQAEDIIFHENAHENELYLIIQGEVEIMIDPALVADSQDTGYPPALIERFWPGQSFGEMALVDEGMRSGSAVAKSEKTHVLRIRRQDLLDLCEAQPELGYRIMYNLAQDLSQKIRNTGLKIRETILQHRQNNGKDPGA